MVDIREQILSGVRNRHLFALDFLFFCVTPAVALVLRTESWTAPIRYAESLALYTAIAVVLRWAVFIPAGLYSRYWRYAALEEVVRILLAVGVATALITLVFLGILRPLGVLALFPRSIPFIDGLLALFTTGGTRLSLALAEQMYRRSQHRSQKVTRVVILGAGSAGAMVLHEIRANPQLALKPVAFLDDDARKHHCTIGGVPVVGDCRQVREVARKYRAEQAIIAMPTAPGRKIRELTQLCQEARLPVKIIPGLFEILSGKVSLAQLRPVDIVDLLRREPVATDMDQMAHLLKGKHVLVTGAGGSIGSELCRWIIRYDPASLILLGHGENSIFEIYHELKGRYPQAFIYPVIADIRDAGRLWAIFRQHRPQIVFHAAAHKHVPLMEENPEEAVTNNVLGTLNLARIAETEGVELFVLISTDKAVNPTSVMGATKRVAELIIQEMARRTGQRFIAVRFGNVLDSRGSVLPLFRQQIARGGPVTVTHSESQRYFMTIPEAVQLILQAAALGQNGEIFVLDMGEPIKIVDLARDLIRLSGLEEGQDIEIVFTGLRPGEKLREELFYERECYSRTSHEKIFVAHNSSPVNVEQTDSNCREAEICDPSSLFTRKVNALIAAARKGDTDKVYRLLQVLVPEYQPSSPTDRLL